MFERTSGIHTNLVWHKADSIYLHILCSVSVSVSTFYKITVCCVKATLYHFLRYLGAQWKGAIIIMKRQLSLQEIKEIELSIFDEFVAFCEENKLRYFLEGGTLLGAVRHNGFIPWDDDIDVSMPRDDYEKFHALYKDNDVFMLKSFKRDQDYIYPFMKLIRQGTVVEEKTVDNPAYGIFIDIFPIDNAPNDRKKRELFQDRVHILLNMLDYSIKSPKHISTGSKTKCFIANIFGTYTIQKFIEKYVTKCNSRDTGISYNVVGFVNRRTYLDSRVFGGRNTVIFEGRECTAPLDVDYYLRTLYGDYMTLPSEEKRVNYHGFDAFIVE